MKRIVFLIVLAAVTLAAMADGWQYSNGKAGIESGEEFCNGNYEKSTVLQLFIGMDASGHDGVLAILEGEYDISDFRDSQQYVMVDFGDFQRHKWVVEQVPFEGRNYKAFIFGNASELIERLRKCEFFNITLPLYRVGTHTFYFNADGYPLDY